MNFLAFAIGALMSGVVVWAIWGRLPETLLAARWSITLAAAAIGGFNGMMYLSALSPARVERELLSNASTREMAQAWQQADPIGFSRFVRNASEVSRRSSPQEAAGAMARDLGLSLRARLSYLKDDEVVALEQNTRDVLLFYAEIAPEACYAVVHGLMPPLSNEQLLHPVPQLRRLGEQRVRIYAAAFRADPTESLASMNEAERGYAVASLFEALHVRFSAADVELLSADEATVAQHQQRYCEVMAEYENQLSMSPRAGPLYRSLLAMSH